MQAVEEYGGTPDYSSLRQLSRRTTGFYDDLESLGVAWLHMLQGSPPWDVVKSASVQPGPWTDGAGSLSASTLVCAEPHLSAALCTKVAVID